LVKKKKKIFKVGGQVALFLTAGSLNGARCTMESWAVPRHWAARVPLAHRNSEQGIVDPR